MLNYECYEFKKNCDAVFNQLKCITKCVSKEVVRFYFNFIYVDEENIVSSNGRVMSVLKLKKDVIEIKPGFYSTLINHKTKIIFKKEDRDCKFVNYKKLMNFDSKETGLVDLKYSRYYTQNELIYKLSRFLEKNNFSKLNSNYISYIPPDEYRYYYSKNMIILESTSTVFDFSFYIAPMTERK